MRHRFGARGPLLVMLLVVTLSPVGAGCSSAGSGRTASTSSTAPSTTTPSTSAPRPEPRALPGTQLKGDVAFLGPIYTVPVNGLTMAYRQFGSGPDLLLIAGQASPMSVWPPSTLAALAKKYRVTMYDNRDLGDTSATSGAFTVADLSDDAAALISTLALDSPAVFGWSTGGEIGLLLAIRHPNALSALSITGATPGGPKSVLPPPDVVELFADSDPDLGKLFDALFTPAGDTKNQYVADILKVPQPTSSARAYAKYDAAEKDYWAKPEPDLDRIKIPVLVMNGADDYAVPSANARYIAQRIGTNAQLELDPGGRHGWFYEHPTHFAALIPKLGAVSKN